MKQYIYLLFALFSICFYSCSNEEAALDSTSKRITVSFTLPEDDTSTRGDETTPATDAEKTMNNVNLYCFDYSGNIKGKLVKATTFSKEQLEQKGLAVELSKGDYYFEAIANEDKLNLDTEDDYADFQALRANTTDYDQWLEEGFLMQGGAAARITNATTSLNIPFTMIRLAARIDVVNKVQGLIITKAIMENSVKESFYLEDASSSIAKEGADKKESRTATGLSIGTSETPTCLFYSYEGDVAKSGLQISFEGTDTDGILHKSLPIVTFANQNAQPAIKRNKLYVVTLEEVDGAVKAEVTVKDWNQKSIDTDVTVEQGLQVDFLELPDNIAVSNISATNGDAVTISIPATGCNLSFQTTSDNIEVEAVETPDSDWLTLSDVTTRAVVQNFTMVATANNSESERTATFVVRNKMTRSTKVTYMVTQAKTESNNE